MKILWLTWKDTSHPEAGGAEVVAGELGKRLATDGHEVTFLVGGFAGGEHTLTRDGYTIIRVGGKFSVYWQAYKYYKEHLVGKDFDIVIEEINTIPFFSKLYLGSKVKSTKLKDGPESTLDFPLSTCNSPRHFLFFHQLAREIWFYQMFFPVSLIGYILEPLYLRLLSTFNFRLFTSPQVITVSMSTRIDLMRYGFKEEEITIISEGVNVPPIESLDDSTKFESPTILSLGSVRPMKRTVDILKGFEYAKERMPSLKLIIAGDVSSPYGKKVAQLAEHSNFYNDIKILGQVTDEKKLELMEKSHLICVTSVKEGWGLVVTEAGRRGTPAVVYNVDGLRDSVKDGVSGLIARQNNPRSLSLSITEALSKPEYYKGLRKNAWEYAKTVTFEQQYKDFKIVTGLEKKPELNSPLTF